MDSFLISNGSLNNQVEEECYKIVYEINEFEKSLDTSFSKTLEENEKNISIRKQIMFFSQEFIHYHNSMLFPTAPLSSTSASMDVRLPTWEVLQETSARLLFMAVRWVRCLVPFQTLSKNDQQLLLQVR